MGKHISCRVYHISLLTYIEYCSFGITMLLNRMRRPHVTVGVDGSVYRFHPKFKSYLDSKIHELIDKDLHFKLKLSEDGSGRGAALVAAVAKRVKEEGA